MMRLAKILLIRAEALVRTGVTDFAEPFGLSADQTRWPIPQGEIDVNENLVQNGGY